MLVGNAVDHGGTHVISGRVQAYSRPTDENLETQAILTISSKPAEEKERKSEALFTPKREFCVAGPRSVGRKNYAS